MCTNNTCGLEIIGDRNRITQIKGDREHPFSRGHICPMAKAAVEYQDAPDRLSHPLRRSGNSWRQIDWRTALDEIADRLGELKSRHGAQCVAVYQGHALLQMLHQGWIARFINLFGTPNLLRNDHLCHVPTSLMEKVTYGSSSLYGFDQDHVGMLVLWGMNPATSASTTLWPAVLATRRKGVPLVVIDPRRTRPARRADLHLAPLPGTDATLAMGLLYLMIKQGRYDPDFVNRWTIGFDALTEQTATYTPDRVSAITGVPVIDMQGFVDLLPDGQPVHVTCGNALEHHGNSSQIIRSICIMRALLGSLDVPGGHQFRESIPLADIRLVEQRPREIPILGLDRYPFFVSNESFVPGDVLVETLLSGHPYKIRAALMGGGNPLLTWPNSNALRRALGQLEFMVAMDTRMTETCQQANIVLPMASFLEKTQLITQNDVISADGPCQYVGLQRPVLDPGLRRSDWWFWKELALRLGFGDAYPWPTEQAAIDHQLAPLKLSFSRLDAEPHGLILGEAHTFRSYEIHGFDTPSGKVELSANRLEIRGQDPLPQGSAPTIQAAYPLILNAGRRSIYYAHSQFRNLACLAKGRSDARAEIHPRTASAYNLSDNDRTHVESPVGSITVKVKITDTVIQGMVSLLHGSPDANANELTDHRNCDPVLATAPLRSGVCRLRPITK
jgi:anaerobic selenocysteine-containing dehydrogenase